jgi:branched-chain amino acid transport system substrate-binding protein
MTEEATTRAGKKSLSRRELVKRAGVGLGGLIVSGGVAEPVLGAQRISVGADASNTIKLGFVSPITGATAGFGEPDPYVLGLARQAFAKGLKVGGTTYAVQIVDRDSQSSPSHAAQVAGDLIHGQNVDLMLATSTPETVNPVADASEAAGLPYITTVVPWEAWYFGRGAKDPTKSPFRYGYHFCFGTANFYNSYTHLWPQVKTNKTVGVMWPNDADGNAIRAALGPMLEKAGYKIVDPGAYQDGTTDYSAQISKFKSANCQIFNTFPIPPDFATFWRQAAQQGYTDMVRIAQIAKTGLFPSQVTALGSLGNNLASACYWHPTWPYRSSLTGITSRQLAAGYRQHSGKQWNQQAGPSLALFDVAAAALRLSGNPKDKNAVAAAVKKVRVETPVGVLDWTKARPGVPFNVVPTPIPGGQWVKTNDKYKVDFVICEHSDDLKIPIGGRLKPY